MKKKNYICLVVGIVLLIIWCVDLLSFFELPDIWEWIKGGYLLIGFCMWIMCFVEACPDTKNEDDKKTKRICDRCGEYIMRDEDSVHYISTKDSNVVDYCEKCKSKVIKE